jgi:DNA-binding Lrp family transcriptional regulator
MSSSTVTGREVRYPRTFVGGRVPDQDHVETGLVEDGCGVHVVGVARDLPAFQNLYDERIATLPGVQRLSSTLVMKSVVENRPLPL